MKRLNQWLGWLFVYPKWFWLLMLGISAALFIVFVMPGFTSLERSSSMRFAGGLMQLGGISLVFVDLFQKLSQFKIERHVQKGFVGLVCHFARKWIREWWSKAPWHGARMMVGTAQGSAQAGATWLRAWHRIPQGATIQDRVDLIEKNIEILRGDDEQVWGRLGILEGEIRKKVEDLRADHEAAIRTVSTELEQSIVGGFGKSLVGTGWLFVGVLLSMCSELY